VAHGTGGPFAAGIFDTQTGRLIAPGVNLVMSLNCSIFHAEVTAILSAQKRLGTFDLGIPQLSPMEIVCSSEPCMMCLGTILWSGIKRLVCGARHEDAERIGFDEGPRPENWPEALEKRGVQVLRNVLRDRAVSVLRIYRDSGGVIYNPSR
jgi:tRNA(Arg) A34 adenosine deaminase TadA